MLNLLKKCWINLRYGATTTTFWCIIMLLVAVFTAFMGEKWRSVAVVLLGFGVCGFGLVWFIHDKSDGYFEIWKSLFSRNFTICQKKGEKIRGDDNLNICPKGLFKSRINAILAKIEKGDTYRAVTHGRMIDLIKKSPAFTINKMDLTIGKMNYVESLRKYESHLYDEKICMKCENKDCRIKNAKENNDFSDQEVYYGIVIKKT